MYDNRNRPDTGIKPISGFYPDNEELYLNHLERNGFSRDSSYTVIIISCHTYDTEKGNELLEAIQRTLHFRLKRTIVYEEEGRLIVLAAGYRGEWLQKEFYELCREDPNLYIGAGTTVNRLKDIHRSYENAYTAYQLTKTTIPKNFLVYDELGIYKILTDIKDPGIYPDFVEEVLGNTQGKGVNIVLNSLYDRAGAWSFELTARGGTFIELGKRDFYEDHPLYLKHFKDNVTYCGVDADALVADFPEVASAVKGGDPAFRL